MNIVITFACGLLFGLGLMVSGMSDPGKVLGFLDLAGNWDPSLMLVMAGAIPVAMVAFYLAKGRQASLLNESLHLPVARKIDGRLIAGSALFGVGWGLAGICPGPAFVLLGSGAENSLVFMLALWGGMLLFELQQRLSHS